jgi:protein-S-isoprenylcysteine O-methyltransferase Ste14
MASRNQIGSLGLPFSVLVVIHSILLLLTGDYSLSWLSGQPVDFLVLGESILFTSLTILVLFVFFWALNHIYFIFSEEPGLLARFGEDLRVYKENVPRWISRSEP